MGHALRKHYGSLGAMLLLLVFLGELTLSIRQQSLSWDEGDHIFAGYMSWKTADFSINPEHPPLVKALATIPLLGMHLTVPPAKGLAYFKDEAYFDGSDFLFKNGGPEMADRMIFRVRMAAATLSLLLGLLVFLAAREMFGVNAALFALTLLVFEPNLIAHGAYVTTDMGISCFMFATIYALYRYVKAPSVGRLAVLGLAAGLALAAKHSGVLLLPMGVALIAAEVLWPQSGERVDRGRTALRLGGAFLAASLIAVGVLWAFYHFRFAAKPGGLLLSPSLAEYVQGLKGFEPRLYLMVAHWHLLPESYLFGLADVRLVSNFFPSYIFGRVHAHGVWYYFPAAFVIKSTAAFMALLLVAGFALATRALRVRREVVFLVVPALIYLLVACGTGLNIGGRHILPMYSFLIVLVSGAVVGLVHVNRRWAYVAGLLLAWHVVSSTRSYPVYLAYSNEFWGGPANTYKYLTDSNTDWAQQLKAVKVYLDERGVKECWFAYFAEPVIPFQAYGIPCKPLPTADSQWMHVQVDVPETITGPVLISAGTLTGYELGSNVMNPYRDFQRLRPVATIQRGVFVYDGTFDMRSASAFGHVTRAASLTSAKQLEAALVEAKTAVQIDPGDLHARMMLGDTLASLGRNTEARAEYQSGLAIAKTMEPDVREDWILQNQKKLALR